MSKLLEQLHQFAGTDFISAASNSFHEKEEGVYKAIQTIYPIILHAFSEQNGDHSNSISRILTSAHNDYQYPGDAIRLMEEGRPDDPAQGLGSHFVSLLFDHKLAGIGNIISNISGINPHASQSLIQLCGGITAAFLGKKMANEGLNFNGLMNWLQENKRNFSQYIPEIMKNYLDIKPDSHPEQEPVTEKSKVLANLADDKLNGKGGGAKWILPIILLGLLGAFLWYWLQGSKAEDGVLPQLEDKKTMNTSLSDSLNNAEVEANSGSLVKGKMNNSGDWIFEKGDSISIKLDNGVEIPTFAGGFEELLYNFIKDPSAKINDEKGDWFDFEDLLFESGKSKLKPGGEQQLKNTIQLLSAFPALKIKVGGYTDNTGDSLSNIKLSEARAKTVYQTLLRYGSSEELQRPVDKSQFDAKHPYEGYGSQWPKADNRTEEGRAQNRRIAIRVMAK